MCKNEIISHENLVGIELFTTFASDKSYNDMKKAKKKRSLLEIAKSLPAMVELVPGFSFDSDSKVKLYECYGQVSD